MNPFVFGVKVRTPWREPLQHPAGEIVMQRTLRIHNQATRKRAAALVRKAIQGVAAVRGDSQVTGVKAMQNSFFDYQELHAK